LWMPVFDLCKPNNHGLTYPHYLKNDRISNTCDLVTTPDSIPSLGDELITPAGKVEVVEIVDSRPARGQHKVENPLWLRLKYR
jgi:hypothetical protein